jgi:hypothetical protein
MAAAIEAPLRMRLKALIRVASCRGDTVKLSLRLGESTNYVKFLMISLGACPTALRALFKGWDIVNKAI